MRPARVLLWFLLPALAGVVALVAGILLAGPASAQMVQLNLGEEGGMATARVVQLMALLTVLSLAPALLIMLTSFIRIIIVLSFMRTAMGAPQTPPNQVLMSLALFVTFFIMMPTFQEAWDKGIEPMIAGQIDEFEAFDRATDPFRKFMLTHVREQDLLLFTDISKVPEEEVRRKAPMRVLIPAFMISELKRGFEMGFLVFVPFLVIDMVVASVLMSLGMMMLPPIIIALPFKVIFFVLVDGWYMIIGSLVKSFG